MNERIKKIAKDAGVLGDWGEDVSEGRFFITGNTKQMEKFAELIVKECCSIIETDLETNQIKAETDNEGRIWVNAQLTFSEVIKLHFGVE